MLKKVLIGIGIVVILGAIGFGYLSHRNRTLSPPGEVHFSDAAAAIKEMSIFYSRPSVKGRLIFGEESAGALQPFGQYWRLGANEGTELHTTGQISIDGNTLVPGKYKIYCYPGSDQFEFAFAKADGAWGYSEPEKDDELFRVMVPVSHLKTPVEQFTIRIENKDGQHQMVFEFSDYQLNLPFN